MLKENKGITLVALVITIIVLLILAGVSIAMISGDEGILTKAGEADEKNSRGELLDSAQLAVAEIFMEMNTPNQAAPKLTEEYITTKVAGYYKNLEKSEDDTEITGDKQITLVDSENNKISVILVIEDGKIKGIS